jgi:uncharacterized membrane protein HdeD (DUF308 family)
MELKSYDKPWLPAIKGTFLIIFGIIGMLRIVGSLKALSVLFIVLICAMAFLLIGTGTIYKKLKFSRWSIISGILNLLFGIFLLMQLLSPRVAPLWIIFSWVIFYAITELIEAGLLLNLKNAFSALFLLNALLTFMFGYFLAAVLMNFTEKSVLYIGIIAFVFGIANVLSSYLLSRLK